MYNMYSYFSIYIFGSAAIHSHNRLQIWVDQILQPDFAYAGAGAGFLLLMLGCLGPMGDLGAPLGSPLQVQGSLGFLGCHW